MEIAPWVEGLIVRSGQVQQTMYDNVKESLQLIALDVHVTFGSGQNLPKSRTCQDHVQVGFALVKRMSNCTTL